MSVLGGLGAVLGLCQIYTGTRHPRICSPLRRSMNTASILKPLPSHPYYCVGVCQFLNHAPAKLLGREIGVEGRSESYICVV